MNDLIKVTELENGRSKLEAEAPRLLPHQAGSSVKTAPVPFLPLAASVSGVAVHV